MTFIIDSNIPFPLGKKGHSPILETCSILEVGQSFLIPTDKMTTISSVQSNVHNFGKKANKTFTIRKFPEGARIWRVK